MNAYIVGAVRTAAGRRKGALSHWHPAELGARAIDGLMAQVGIAPEMMHRIDDVIFGCVSQVGAQSCNVARGAVLSSALPLGWAKDVGADPTKLNVNGGACALGHPLGATGAKLMTTLLHELERTNARYGLQAICEGGGTANATIIERV